MSKQTKNITTEQLQKAVDEQNPEVKKIIKRQVVIETDGLNINIVKNECNALEFEMILLKLLDFMRIKRG